MSLRDMKWVLSLLALFTFTVNGGDKTACFRRFFRIKEAGNWHFNKWLVPEDPPGMSFNGTIANGFFDGAVLRVYRPGDDGLQHVATGSVGRIFRKSGWITEGYPCTKVAATVDVAESRAADRGPMKRRRQRPLRNGVPYYYAVTAIDANGNESAFSDEICVVPAAKGGKLLRLGIRSAKTPKTLKRTDALRPPSGLKGMAYAGAVLIEWTPSPSPGIVAYRLHRSTAPMAEQQRVYLQEDWLNVAAGDFAVVEACVTNSSLTSDQDFAALKQEIDSGARSLLVDPCLSDQDWLNLLEYLVAPFDAESDTARTKPYAHLRGKAKPPATPDRPVEIVFDTTQFNRLIGTGKFDLDMDAYRMTCNRLRTRVLPTSPYWKTAFKSLEFRRKSGETP